MTYMKDILQNYFLVAYDIYKRQLKLFSSGQWTRCESFFALSLQIEMIIT